MKCPACGAALKKISRKCTECGALLKKNADGALEQATVEGAEAVIAPQPSVVATDAVIASAASIAPKPTVVKAAPSLIAFPGVNRKALPEWRKELSERVREKQERRAREAQLEVNSTGTAMIEAPSAGPVLELLPQAELEPLNPIVEAALKRIERAHLQSFARAGGGAAAAAQLAQPEPLYVEQEAEVIEEPVVEKTHNLAVVPNPAPVEDQLPPPIKPKRLIADSNDPALNYLDAIPTALLIERREFAAAGTARRLMAAIVDLGIMLILSSPLMMLDPVTTLNLQNWRAMLFSAGSLMLVGFLYLTIVTALTGRTLGMSVFSLRIVDARTGLIPTGSQAAGRAIIYLPSLLSGGLLSLYLFLDSERQTLHDRFTRTAVVRA